MTLNNKKGLQLSNMIIMMLITVAITSGFFIWISNGITQYSVTPPDGYNESFTRIQNIYTDIDNNLQETQTKLNNTQGNSNFIDYFGFIINAGLSAAKTTVGVMSSMGVLVEVAVDESALGAYGDLIRILFLIAIIVVFIVGILLNFIIKSGRE